MIVPLLFPGTAQMIISVQTDPSPSTEYFCTVLTGSGRWFMDPFVKESNTVEFFNNDFFVGQDFPRADGNIIMRQLSFDPINISMIVSSDLLAADLAGPFNVTCESGDGNNTAERYRKY